MGETAGDPCPLPVTPRDTKRALPGDGDVPPG